MQQHITKVELTFRVRQGSSRDCLHVNLQIAARNDLLIRPRMADVVTKLIVEGRVIGFKRFGECFVNWRCRRYCREKLRKLRPALSIRSEEKVMHERPGLRIKNVLARGLVVVNRAAVLREKRLNWKQRCLRDGCDVRVGHVSENELVRFLSNRECTEAFRQSFSCPDGK